MDGGASLTGWPRATACFHCSQLLPAYGAASVVLPALTLAEPWSPGPPDPWLSYYAPPPLPVADVGYTGHTTQLACYSVGFSPATATSPGAQATLWEGPAQAQPPSLAPSSTCAPATSSAATVPPSPPATPHVTQDPPQSSGLPFHDGLPAPSPALEQFVEDQASTSLPVEIQGPLSPPAQQCHPVSRAMDWMLPSVPFLDAEVPLPLLYPAWGASQATSSTAAASAPPQREGDVPEPTDSAGPPRDDGGRRPDDSHVDNAADTDLSFLRDRDRWLCAQKLAGLPWGAICRGYAIEYGCREPTANCLGMRLRRLKRKHRALEHLLPASVGRPKQ